MKRFRLIVIVWAVLFFITPFITAADGVYEKLMSTAREKGYAKVILQLDVKDIKQLTEKSTQYKTVTPGARFPAAGYQADLDLELAIRSTADALLYRLNSMDYRVNHTYMTLPYLALDVSPETLALLPSFPEVLDILEDSPTRLVESWEDQGSGKQPLESRSVPAGADKPMLNGSTGVIGADNAWAMGYTGSGWYVAILDTGIRRSHQFFTGKTIREACFSASSDCPNGSTSMTGTGAAAHYESTYEGYDHGTHVSGIAAGNYGSLSGVAKNSNIIAVQVFSRFGSEDCDGSPCVMSYSSDQAKGLEYIYSLRSSYSIAAVNMSLGGGAYSSYCNGAVQKTAIDNLKSVRIATAIATGNDSYCGYVGSPSCIQSAVAVGASSDSDIEAGFNNWHKTLQELFAPGVSIYSSTGTSNSSYASWSGTSMATPHVTGTWALLRQASPTASVDDIFTVLRSTGASITTLCSSGGSCPRIQVDDAITELLGGSTTASITVTSPNGGEKWNVGSKHTISWAYTGTVGNVQIEYTTNNGSSWSTVVSSTANDGAYSWTIPNTISSKCKVRVKEASDGSPSDTSDTIFSIIDASSPKIALSRTQLYFCGTAGNTSASTSAQVVWLNNGGGGTLEWSAGPSTSWLTCSPTSGTDVGVLTVSVSTTGLKVGTYTGFVNVSDPNADNSPQAISVSLKIINSSQDQQPFGNFATPGDGTTVRSSIPVTGWVLDDIEVQSVKIYINNGYVGDAIFVEGARPDVEQAYPGYPKNYRAGWGYMLLTNVLTDGFKTVSAVATDNTGHKVTLGSSTIKIDNANAVKPFGAMDTPAQGGGASGNKYRNQGWVLTPKPNKIPVDGSTIKVYVDGKYLGHVNYNIYRSDIANLFPGYTNSNGALGYFEFNTSSYSNGVHTIQWTATDNGGNSDGIGSRYFTVQNTGSNSGSEAQTAENPGISLSQLPPNPGSSPAEPVRVHTGYNEHIPARVIYPDEYGIFTIESKELERIEISLADSNGSDPLLSDTSGYMTVGDVLRPLPVGSTLESRQGKFYWLPGPGYLGVYELVFIVYKEGVPVQKRIRVNILPKF